MNLLISGKLTRPPSSVHCFRDITLYATVFADYDVLLTCQRQNRDKHWRWLKEHGAFDYVQDIVCHGEETGISISPIPPYTHRVDRITAHDLNRIIGYLSVYR